MKSFWNWLDGKKTMIGALAANVLPWFILKQHWDPSTANMVMGSINTVTGVGLVHKLYKATGSED